MANFKISTPGKLVNCAVGFDVPAGDSIDEASIAITSNVPDVLSAADIAVNDATETIDEQDYAAGSAVLFSLVCAADAAEADEDSDSPYYVYIDYSLTNSPTERLRWKKLVEVFSYIPIA